MKKLLLLIVSLSFILPCFSETIKLKSVKIVEAKIIEKTDSYVKVDIAGIPITYYLDEIESIDGVLQSKKNEEILLPQTASIDLSSSGINTEKINALLEHLGYPEQSWPDIERELIVFLTKIDFPRLKQEAAQVKLHPEQLRQFVSEMGKLIEKEGCLNIQSPHPLIKLLVTSISTEDIFQVIDISPISADKKNELKGILVSCTAVSQLGSIALYLLDFNVKAVFATTHAFNYIPLDNRQVLFLDFFNTVFENVDINQYYKLEGKHYVLKEEYRISPKKVHEIQEQWRRGIRPNSLKEILNTILYFNIHITDDYVITPVIYTNYAKIYIEDNGYPDQAIVYCNKAIELNPNIAQAYYNRGLAYDNKNNFNQAMLDYGKAIQINPNDVDAQINRGIIYGKEGNLDQAILCFNKAIETNPNYAKAYYNRGFAYHHKDNLSQAMSDYSKAIELNPNFADAYNMRGYGYFINKDYSRALRDVQKAESLGYKVDLKFLKDLKKASGREK
ncbi:MAG: tetratricopeptide repeat protein [Candidatus Omnitrophica bacterium]|nr:tetratricopeptide repeat protein [Candidatus Omnitrophota bacterium]